MEDTDFLKSVAEDVHKALNAGGYNEIEFFDEDVVKMYGVVGENIEGEQRIARTFKPHSDKHIIVTISYIDDGKYKIIVTLDKEVDFREFDKKVGDPLKQLSARWGDKLGYMIQKWGREIHNKDDIKRQIGKNPNGDNTMTNKVDEARVGMTGTTKSSYQKIGECKVIVRHTAKVNEDKHGARSRNIQAIFIETKGGERFRVSQNNLHGARAMARHLSNSGSPFDTVGNKITTMMNEMENLKELSIEARKLGGEDSLMERQQQLTIQIREKYIGLRETLKKMSGIVGYGRQISTLEEGKTSEKVTTTKEEKKKETETVRNDQVPVYDRSTDKGFDDLTRDADDLFSVNEDYGKSPEETMLEEWFDAESTVEFFNEEELAIEDTIPTIKKTLPETALHMLNVYQGHPLFKHYIKEYKKQEIIDDVLALTEEESVLYKKIREFANYGIDSMNVGRAAPADGGNNGVVDIDGALKKVQTLISDRRLSLENAINQVAKEMGGMNADSKSKDEISEELWSAAENAGLVMHDFGSTFSDEILSPNETIDAHQKEIDAEEFYGDAKFTESLADFGEGIEGFIAAITELKNRGYPYEDAMSFAKEEWDVAGFDEAEIEHVVNSVYDVEDSAEFDDGMDGDHDSAMTSAGMGSDEDYGYFGDDMYEEMNRVRINAGLPPLSEAKSCSCDCDNCGDECKCATDCDCGCKSIKEGDPFGRQSKRHLKNPKERMSLINPEDKITKSFSEDEVEEAKAIPDWVKGREETMVNRLDRKQSRDFEPRGDEEPDDKYAAMAKKQGVTGNERPKKTVRGVRENENYVEVDMPHHLPKVAETQVGEPQLSEDGARIIQLARYKTKQIIQLIIKNTTMIL